MRRRLLTVAIFLLAGAVVNVGVAWGCALWRDMTDTEGVLAGFGRSTVLWRVAKIRRSGLTVLISERRRYGYPRNPTESDRPVPAWGNLDISSPDFESVSKVAPDEVLVERRCVTGSGWPMRSFWCEWEGRILLIGNYYGGHGPPPTPPITKFSRILSTSGGYIATGLRPKPHGSSLAHSLGAPRTVPRVIPLRPIWLGFAVNTLLYATLLWLLIYGLTLRRFLRVRRGLCPKCAYPMGESAGCTECGTDLPKRVRAAT